MSKLCVRKNSFLAQISNNGGLYEVIITIKPIKGVKAFSDAIKNSKRFRSEKAIAYVCFYHNSDLTSDCKEQNSTFILNYGIILSKKIIKKAVVRNRIKRLIRESLRIIARENGEQLTNVKSIILSWNRNPMHPKLIKLDEVLSEIRDLINKILIYISSKN